MWCQSWKSHSPGHICYEEEEGRQKVVMAESSGGKGETYPCRLFLVHLQEKVDVEALNVRAGQRTSRVSDPHLR